MALTQRFVVLFVSFSVLKCAFSATTGKSVDKVLNALVDRIESLEAQDDAKNAKIAQMELKIVEMELNSNQRESILQHQIDELKTTLEQSNGETEEQQLDTADNTDRQHSMSRKIKRHRRNTIMKREAPETEVAFYATHTDHDVHHLGSDQPIPFQLPVTNLGNAFNNNTGAFVAPVDGTYVIHATIRAIDTNHYDHLRAYIDINGVPYSTFWVSANDQSSQMLVIEIRAGQTVTVRNSYSNNGFVGRHYSTFSGFLLYQHYPSGPIIGK